MGFVANTVHRESWNKGKIVGQKAPFTPSSASDALTWLVLGRAPAGLGRDETALLQRVALALLAGERSGDAGFLQRLGLDELSFSLGGAGEVNGGTLQLIYRIADRITLRARTGTENAIDAVWTWRWN